MVILRQQPTVLPSGNLAGPFFVCFDLIEMGDQPRRDRLLKLIVHIASWVISAYAAVVIFAISLAAYADGSAEWAHGNPYKETLLLGLFLSVSAIGIVAIQTNVERSRTTVLIVGAVVGGMGSLTLTVFTVGSLNPIVRILNPSNAVEAIILALATLVTILRTRSVIKMAFGSVSHPRHVV
jgi:hypothetical protein